MDTKTYFSPGDVVQLRQAKYIKSPNMLVVRKVSSLFKDEDTSNFRGILCRWFTDSNLMQEAIFNFKDLVKLN